MLQLVSFDTDRIKDYLFATTVLNDVRQASSLLDRLNREQILSVLNRVARGSTVHLAYAAGGSAIAVLANQQVADEAIRAVEALYRRETVVASITGVRVPVCEDDLRERFGKKVRQAGHLLRRRKEEKGRALSLPVAPYVRPCDACGRWPAARPDRERGKFVCRACWIKRKDRGATRYGLRQRLVQVAEGTPPEAPQDEWADLIAATCGDTRHREVAAELPQDLSAIGELARRPGYVALVYADGNNMGRVLENLVTRDRYRKFAALLDDLLLRITYRRLMEHVEQHPRKPVFELLMAGGDDLMLVTTPDIALQLVPRVMEDFQHYSPPLARDGGAEFLSLSVGVLIAKAAFPMSAMRDLAEALQLRAKQRSFEADGAGAVDFMVVTGPGSQSLDRVREEILTGRGFAFPPGDGQMYRLTRRPYVAGELETLLRTAEELKQKRFPSGHLQAMYEALFWSPAQASLVTLQTVGRARNEHREVLERFFREVEGAVVPPWHEGDSVRETALGDLVEIYPFL